MTLAAEKTLAHLGETCGCADHDHDLIHELSRRLDSLWRYDQYIANADGRPGVQQFWRLVKSQELETVKQLKSLIVGEIKADCF